MGLDLDLLKKHLQAFADKCNLTIEDIGSLADESSSVDVFKSKLDELCFNSSGKKLLEVLAEFSMKLPSSNPPINETPTENSPLQNELVEVNKKIDELREKDKTPKAESNS